MEAMRQWQWLRGSASVGIDPPGLDLSYVVNRLAMEDFSPPHSIVLDLLCSGELVATGHYNWRQYKFANHFQMEGVYELIPISRWIQLRESINELEERFLDYDYNPSVSLRELSIECDVYYWEFSANHFALANYCPGEGYDLYCEEWYSVRGIKVWPRWLDETDEDQSGTGDDIDLDSPPRRGGRKPANWWPGFAEELAMFCLENGIPAGSGTEGQSQMIKTIFESMAERGMAEPSRTQVQTVINAVLLRWRAGNSPGSVSG